MLLRLGRRTRIGAGGRRRCPTAAVPWPGREPLPIRVREVLGAVVIVIHVRRAVFTRIAVTPVPVKNVVLLPSLSRRSRETHVGELQIKVQQSAEIDGQRKERTVVVDPAVHPKHQRPHATAFTIVLEEVVQRGARRKVLEILRRQIRQVGNLHQVHLAIADRMRSRRCQQAVDRAAQVPKSASVHGHVIRKQVEVTLLRVVPGVKLDRDEVLQLPEAYAGTLAAESCCASWISVDDKSKPVATVHLAAAMMRGAEGGIPMQRAALGRIGHLEGEERQEALQHRQRCSVPHGADLLGLGRRQPDSHAAASARRSRKVVAMAEDCAVQRELLCWFQAARLSGQAGWASIRTGSPTDLSPVPRRPSRSTGPPATPASPRTACLAMR
eukprot:scaffold4604_cov257-Pinguiococcus_pyrenoidosus.AAC.6